MKNNNVKTWKKLVTAVMLAVLTLAFSGCDNTEESSTAEVVTTTTTAATETTTTTRMTTTNAKTTVTSSETTASETTTTVTTAEAEKAQTTAPLAEPLVEKPKTTTAKPVQQSPAQTTAAPKGHYETVHHEAVTEQVWVEDSPATEKKIFQCSCGAQFFSSEDYFSHVDSIDFSELDKHYNYQFWYEDIPSQGHYETKIIKAAYDEQVWVQD